MKSFCRRYWMRIVKWYDNAQSVMQRLILIESCSIQGIIFEFQSDQLFLLRSSHVTNPMRDCTVKSARKARRYLRKNAAHYVRGIKEILVGSASESVTRRMNFRRRSRRIWSTCNCPPITSSFIGSPRLGKENDKNIYVPRKLHRRRSDSEAPSECLTHLNCTTRRKVMVLLHAPLNWKFNYFIARHARVTGT